MCMLTGHKDYELRLHQHAPPLNYVCQELNCTAQATIGGFGGFLGPPGQAVRDPNIA